jgi:hypothetical protein
VGDGPAWLIPKLKAREREQDLRREERLQPAKAMMAEILAGPPEFVDLTVVEEWTG